MTSNFRTGDSIVDLLPFIPEELVGLEKRWGRRWAVTQSLVYGGRVDTILARAERFETRRARDLGVSTAVGIASEGRHLKSRDSDYPGRLITAGWTVLWLDERWIVEPPA